MYINNKWQFTKKEIADAIRIWNSAAISVLDIRHRLLSPMEEIQGYRLPASTFIFTGGTKSEVFLNDVPYQVERFGLFHGGKGMELTIRPIENWLEYYLVLYKPEEPPFHRREYGKLLERSNPFRQQYGFEPDNPIFLAELLRRMFEAWKQPTPLNCFYEKSAFYQFVYEVYKELEAENIHVLEPDAVLTAKRYMERHYAEGLSVREIAESLGLSASHFRSIFKRRTSVSPQEYLMNCRINAAKSYLTEGKYSLREIAQLLGFSNEFHFSNAYKKATGMAPQAHKAIFLRNTGDSCMGNLVPFPYNEESQVSLDQLKGKGATYMLKQMRSKSIAAAALALMLLLTACSTVPANTSETDSAPASANTSQESETEVMETLEKGTRTISTMMGDVEVPVTPQRVIVDYLIGDVVALGVVPVGVSKEDYAGANTAFADQITESTNVGEWDLEPEAVMALDPDLIILAFSEEPYEELSKIAPTIFVPYGEMSTEERMEFMGQVLNRTEEAQAAISAYADKIQEGKQKLKDAGLSDVTVTIAQISDNGNYIAGSKHAAGALVYDELGISAPQKVQTDIIDADEYWGVISMEVLESYCGDYIITLDEIPDSTYENAVFNLIPAVQNEHILNTDTAITWYTDLTSMSALVDIVVDGLISLNAE